MKSVSIKEMVKTLIVHTTYDKVDVQSVWVHFGKSHIEMDTW